jgi:hypothetical protein
MKSVRTTLCIAALSAIGASPSVIAQAPRPAVNETAAAVHAFQQKVAEYVKLHNEAESKIPNLGETDDPAKIAAREAALGQQLRQMRAGARPGDIFVKEFQPFLMTLVRRDFADRPRGDRRALLEEQPKAMAIEINMTYPAAVPLATFPGRLLKALPDLPPELEYRLVGRHLILRDVKANIIVDYVRDAVPMT